MEDAITQRIKKIIDSKGLSISSLSSRLNIVRTTLNRQISGETSSIPVSTIEAILHHFPDISAEWLLRGTGTMEKVNQQIGNITASTAIGNNVNGSGNNISHSGEISFSVIESYIGIIGEKDKQINRLLCIIESALKNNSPYD